MCRRWSGRSGFFVGILVIVWMRLDQALEELWSGKSWRDAPEPYAPRPTTPESQARIARGVILGLGVALATVLGVSLLVAVTMGSQE